MLRAVSSSVQADELAHWPMPSWSYTGGRKFS
jgi:hypothetical protein